MIALVVRSLAAAPVQGVPILSPGESARASTAPLAATSNKIANRLATPTRGVADDPSLDLMPTSLPAKECGRPYVFPLVKSIGSLDDRSRRPGYPISSASSAFWTYRRFSPP